MRYSPEHKAASRQALVSAAARIFREKGYSGVGVDEVSGAAGLTSGSFYKHFAAKSEALLEVVRDGVDRIAKRVRIVRSSPTVDPNGGWVNDFATLQSSPEHFRCVGQGCNLPSLSAEVARADGETKAVYEESLLEGVRAMLESEPFAGEPDGEARAVAMLCVLSGGTMIARAVATPETEHLIAEAVRRAALLIANNPLPDVPRSRAEWAPIDGQSFEHEK